MADEEIEVNGKIVAVLPGTMFRVELENGHRVLAHISGKLRKNFIKITTGDTVKMIMSPYDLEQSSDHLSYQKREYKPKSPSKELWTPSPIVSINIF